MVETERATRELLVELLGVFYAKGWVSGTGGGICGPADGGGLLLAPSGVHKERSTTPTTRTEFGWTRRARAL